MEEVSMLGLDIAKTTFQAHGAAADGGVVFARSGRGARCLSFCHSIRFVVLRWQACAFAHHRGREIAAPGHDVRLIPPVYVKPFVKRQSEAEQKMIQ